MKKEEIKELKELFVDEMLAPVVFFDDKLNIIYMNNRGKKYFSNGEIKKLKRVFKSNLSEKDIDVFLFDGKKAILRTLKFNGKNCYCLTIFEEEMQKTIFGRVVENIEIPEEEYSRKLLWGFFHDLKNIFQVIKGNAELIAKLDSGDKVKRVSNRILVSVEGAITIAKNFMAFYEAGNEKTKPINIIEQIKMIWDSFKESSPPGIKLILRGDLSKEVYVKITPIEVQQILVNLLSNALDAVSDGGEIELGFDLRESDKSYFTMWVRDNGEGMDEKTLKNIFKPYYTTKKSGTGLGLYLLYMIVKKRGGKISVVSEPKKGTKFKIYFVVDEKTKKKKRVQIKSLKGKALVVEDNAMYRTLVMKVLKERGYETIAFDTLKKAIEAYEKGKDFSLIVVDIILPDGNGVYLIEKIRNDNKSIPIIITTSLRDTEAFEMLGDFSGIKFLRKPFVVERVNSIIDEVEKELKKIRRVKK